CRGGQGLQQRSACRARRVDGDCRQRFLSEENSPMSRKGFQPGHTGRPRGTRNKLTAQVFEDLLAHWTETVEPGSALTKGQEALRALHLQSPGEYLRLVASTLPKELVMETAVGDLDDEQIDTLIMQLRQRALEARSAPPTLLASPEPVKEPVPPAAETSAPDGAKEKWNDEPRH